MNREDALAITKMLMKILEEAGVTYDEADVISKIFESEVSEIKERQINTFTASAIFSPDVEKKALANREPEPKVELLIGNSSITDYLRTTHSSSSDSPDKG